MGIDSIRQRIIEYVGLHSFVSNTQIARALGTDVGDVASRTNKLFKDGVLQRKQGCVDPSDPHKRRPWHYVSTFLTPGPRPTLHTTAAAGASECPCCHHAEFMEVDPFARSLVNVLLICCNPVCAYKRAVHRHNVALMERGEFPEP